MNTFTTVPSVIVTDQALSLDSAVALIKEAQDIEENRRRRVLIWSCALSATLQITLSLIINQLLRVPYLRLVAASGLYYVASGLVREEKDKQKATHKQRERRAIERMVWINTINSSDNAIGTALISQHQPIALAIGLVASITMLFFVIAKGVDVMKRWPRLPQLLINLAALIMAWQAGALVAEEPRLHLAAYSLWWAMGSALVMLAIILSMRMRKRHRA